MQYVANSGAVTLTAATAKTAIMVKSAAKVAFMLVEFAVSFNGTTATNEPVLIELVKSTNATNSSPGTNNTEVKPVQVRGGKNTGGEGESTSATAFAASTSEPTVLTVLKEWRISPTSGLIYQAPLGREPEAVPGTEAGLGLRLTAAQEVKARCYIEFATGPS